MRHTYLSLQYLRGIAALLVVLAHTTEYPVAAGAAVPEWTGRTGGVGVLTFFVISGFIITVVTGPGRFDPAVFAWRRLLRVVPLYWLCTGFLFAVTLVAPALFKTTVADVRHLVLSLLFIPHPAPGDGSNYWSPLLKPGWTLNFEVFFYAVTASLFWCGSRRVRGLLVSLVLGTLIVLSFGDKAALGPLAFYASSDLIAFVAGIWLAELALSSGNRQPPAWLPVVGALVASLAFVWVYRAPDEHATIAPTLIAAVAIVATALGIERRGHLPGWPALAAIGDASYSLYLTHMFTVGLVWAVLRKIVTPERTGFAPLGIVMSIAAAVAVALVSYRLVERPFIRLSHRRGPEAVPAASSRVSA